MIQRKHLFSLTGAALLLAIGVACAQTQDSKPAAIVPAKKDEAVPSATSTTSSDQLSQADIQRVSEAFGHFIGRNLKTPGIQLDLESIIKGMRDGAAGKSAPMTDKEYEALMTKLQESAYKQLSSENLKNANAFLDKNAKASGIVVVEPGKLQYLIEKQGTGEVVKEHDSPLIQYTGKYIDGTTFGSSTDAGGPITIPLDQTIPGFSKGILGMKEGEKRKLYVHPDLGYGTTGHLPPNSLLIFDVEVIKANAPEQSTDTSDAADNDMSLSDDMDIEDEDISDQGDEDEDMDSESTR